MSEADCGICLNDLPPGAGGRVTGVLGAPEIRQRLREMGLTTGATVEVVRRAPLGDPMDIKIRGYHLSIRATEAACVRVETAPARGAPA